MIKPRKGSTQWYKAMNWKMSIDCITYKTIQNIASNKSFSIDIKIDQLNQVLEHWGKIS